MRALLALALVLPATLHAQAMCTTETGHVPDCMVGLWSGGNDMAERFDLVFRHMPEHLWASLRESSGQYLFLRVAENGHYITSPLDASGDLTILSDDGYVGNLEVALTTTGATGLFTTSGSEDLAFCGLTGMGMFTMRGAAPDGAHEVTAPVLPDGAVETMPMRYACHGERLNLFVDLPPPFGTVTYDLARIPESRIPADIIDLMDGM